MWGHITVILYFLSFYNQVYHHDILKIMLKGDMEVEIRQWHLNETCMTVIFLLHLDVWRQNQGPLHTWTKSRDHEIVRAQKKVFKGRPNIPPELCSVVTTLKCIVKSYVTGSLTKCYFNDIMHVLTHDKIEYVNGCERLECMVSRCCVRPTSKRWFLRIIQVTVK